MLIRNCKNIFAFLSVLFILAASEAALAKHGGGGGGKQKGGQWSDELREDLDAPVESTLESTRVSSFVSLGGRYNERPQQSTDELSEENGGESGGGGGVMAILTGGTRLRKTSDSFGWGGTARLTTMPTSGLTTGVFPTILRATLPQEWRNIGTLSESAVVSLIGTTLSAVSANATWSSGPTEYGLDWTRGSQKVANLTTFGNRFQLSQNYTFPAIVQTKFTLEEGYAQNNDAAAYPFVGLGTQGQTGWNSSWGKIQFFMPVKFQYDFSPAKAHVTTIGPGFRHIYNLPDLGNISVSIRESLSYSEQKWTTRLMIMGLFSSTF